MQKTPQIVLILMNIKPKMQPNLEA